MKLKIKLMVPTRLSRAFFPLTFGHLALLAGIWLQVGFTTGTETLLGPVRWVSSFARNHALAENIENILVKLIMLVFVIGSLFLSLFITRAFLRTRIRHVKFAIAAILLVASLGSLYFWLNPQIFGAGDAGEEQASVSSRFIFGPYPTLEKMTELKSRRFTAVVSLLHPAVVPFEPKLLEDEKAAIQDTGMEFIHIPMLPWISENEASLEQIRLLAEAGEGKYYIHCYLGKDRVNVVKRILESRIGEVRSGASLPGTTPRRLEDRPEFERGFRFIVSENIYITPYPTEEEFLAYVLSGSIQHVVSLLDPENPEDLPWIETERRLFQRYGMAFSLMPITLTSYDPDNVLRIARAVEGLPRPLLIHGFLSPSPRIQAIVQALRTHLPPLPPMLFKKPLAGGAVEIIAPNIALGPRPTGPEFGGVLARKGIRAFGYLGESGSQEAEIDSRVLEQAGLPWRIFAPYSGTEGLFEAVASDGPWYLYGPMAAVVREDLIERFGPVLPDGVTYEEGDQASRAEEDSGAEKSRGLIGFVTAALPDLRMIILLGPLFILYAWLGAAWAGRLRMEKGVRTPYTRKVFHFFIFTMAGVLQITMGFPAVVLFGSIVSLGVLYAVWRGDGFPFYEAMARPTDAPHRSFFILVPLITTALGGGLSNLFFRNFAYVGYFVGGWGDAVGEPVGTRWGKHKYRVPSLLGVSATRSLEGSAAVFFFGSLVACFSFVAAGYPVGQALLTALACGAAGALVEAFSSHGLDNLTIQVAASAAAWLILR